MHQWALSWEHMQKGPEQVLGWPEGCDPGVWAQRHQWEQLLEHSWRMVLEQALELPLTLKRRKVRQLRELHGAS